MQAAAWLDAEFASLQAAAGYALASGRFRHAMLIPAALAAFLLGEGYWDQARALHQTAVAAAGQAGDRHWQARALRAQWVQTSITAPGKVAAQVRFGVLARRSFEAGQVDGLLRPAAGL